MSLEKPTNREVVEEFRYKPGKLYIRSFYTRKHGQEENHAEDTLFFELPDKQWRLKEVARFAHGKTRPSNERWTDNIRKNEGITEGGNRVEQLPATDDDLEELMRTYDDPDTSLQEWVDNTCNIDSLDKDEKDRLCRIAKKIVESM